MKRILQIFLFLTAVPACGSHIVGGEFEFLFKGIHASTGYHRYTLSMILYFDKRNGNPGALDNSVTIRIFRKSDNAIIINALLLELDNINAVQYKKPDCSSGGSLQTDRIFYTFKRNGVQAEILLDPAQYNDPGGYYISWERCCRNYNITNIYSEDPNSTTGRYAGQTFYLEFPPLLKNSQTFINSAPTLFSPLSDYACIGRLYTVDFGGTDPDGDSLVYSMVVPLNTKSGDALPPGGLPRPGPYPVVSYRSPFSQNNIMGGAPDLKISKSGMLSVIPTKSGLFVFAVLCEEYRNGERIGEIRRDFQLLVLSNCPQATPPVVEAKKRIDTEFIRNQLTVAFTNDATDEERCIDIRVSDPDAATQAEKIKIVAVAVNFENDDLSEILPPMPEATLKDGESQMFAICFPACPYKPESYVVDIIVLNESCGGALMDTVRVDVRMDIPPNNLPLWSPQSVTETVTEGGKPLVVKFTGTDADGDDLEVIPPAFATQFAKYGFSWTLKEDVPGRVEAELRWDTECDMYDFSVKRSFEFSFILDDLDKCDLTPNDTLVFKLTRDIRDFHDPVIEYEPNKSLKKINLSERIYKTVNFNTLISDKDNDRLEVTGVGKGFDFATYGASYPSRTLTGTTSVPTTAPFVWPLNCDKINLKQKDTFNFYLIVTDTDNLCGYTLADTLDVTLKVLPPENLKPELAINNVTVESEIHITLGEDLSVPVVGTDNDINPADMLTLELIDASGNVLPEGFTFTTTPSVSPVLGTLSWNPGCEIFKDNIYENQYQFRFRVMDNRCFNPRGDTLAFTLKIKDRDAGTADFLPPNVITPNEDDKNNFFAMVRLEPDGTLQSILPKDNCAGRFVLISIMNRWGREVFRSSDRDFRWYADNQPSGEYFYLLKFSDKEYKGIISVLGGNSSKVNR
jgi:hypothetical protein